MRWSIFLCLILISSCSSVVSRDGSVVSKLTEYNLTDVSGQFIVKRSVIQKNGKIFTKTQLYNADEPDRELEKTLAVSVLGVQKSGGHKFHSSRPKSSQFEVWYEGKKHFSQLVVNPKTRKLEVLMKSPTKQYSGTKEYKFPRGSVFCFFSQIPECLKSVGFVKKSITQNSGSLQVYVIWDSFPYQREQYSGMSKKPFSSARISYEGEQDDGYRFTLSFDQQSIFYHFGKDAQFDKMFWVAQGITLTRAN